MKMRIYKLFCTVVAIGGILALLYLWLLLLLWLAHAGNKGQFIAALFLPILGIIYTGILYPLFWRKGSGS